MNYGVSALGAEEQTARTHPGPCLRSQERGESALCPCRLPAPLSLGLETHAGSRVLTRSALEKLQVRKFQGL